MNDLIARLETWTEEGQSFHGNRQLADEVLIADGWTVTKDEAFAGGFRWSWGKNPTYHSSEAHRPHPINDLAAAVGVVPFKAAWSLTNIPGQKIRAVVWAMDGGDANPDHIEALGQSERPAVAITIAALKFIQLTRPAA